MFIIEQAELMNPQAQNACLKTLEEPEGRTLIILLIAFGSVLAMGLPIMTALAPAPTSGVRSLYAS